MTDIERLAKAVLSQAIKHDVERGMNAYNVCNQCGASVFYNEPIQDIQHSADCPVLLAQTVTGVTLTSTVWD